MTKTLLFGKYKGHTVAEVLAGDPEYLRWLCSQDDFRSSHRVLYRDIIDCVEGLVDAPARKAMRVRFQDANFCRRFLQASGHGGILLHAVRARHAKALEEIADRLRNLKEATDGAKNYIDDFSHQAWAQANGIFLNPVDRERQLAGFELMNAALHDLRKRLPNQLEAPKSKVSCRFEQHGFDAVIRASIRYPWGPELRKNYLGSHDDVIRTTVAVKMRWAVGNNYHPTVRWIDGNRNVSSGINRSSPIADHVVLLVGRYDGNNAAKERFVGELAAADIKAVFAADLKIP